MLHGHLGKSTQEHLAAVRGELLAVPTFPAPHVCVRGEAGWGAVWETLPC